ncbi:MAG: aspartyl/asparaginyl beta-hydroxylase domain-containing protein [Halioglobus sp.]
MDIEYPLTELGEFAVTEMRNAILGLDETAWQQNTYRQRTYEVHRDTQSIVLVFTDGSGWPDIQISKEPGWDLLAKQALPLMNQIIGRHYPPGGAIVRAMAVKLLAGGAIKSHRDKHPSFYYSHRVHIPISSNPLVRFMLDGQPHNLKVGKVYEINNQKQHSVSNKGHEDRINFIFDYLPPQHLGQGGALFVD